MRTSPLNIDCRELTMDEQLTLASQISDALQGRGIALVNGAKIVIDSLGKGEVDRNAVEAAVSDFVDRRKEQQHYSIERTGDSLVVHSADPAAAGKRGIAERLPPNLLKCPFCSFVTPYQELLVVHTRSHGFVS